MNFDFAMVLSARAVSRFASAMAQRIGHQARILLCERDLIPLIDVEVSESPRLSLKEPLVWPVDDVRTFRSAGEVPVQLPGLEGMPARHCYGICEKITVTLAFASSIEVWRDFEPDDWEKEGVRLSISRAWVAGRLTCVSDLRDFTPFDEVWESALQGEAASFARLAKHWLKQDFTPFDSVYGRGDADAFVREYEDWTRGFRDKVEPATTRRTDRGEPDLG